MTALQSAINAAQAKNPRAVVAQPLNERTADCATDGVQDALAAFGIPKSKRGARLHVVLRAPSRSVDACSGLPDSDGPRYRATRSLSDRAPFAYALSGIDEARVERERKAAPYSWSPYRWAR